MERATLLLSGVPRYVPLADLSYHLNLLFNTDDIGTFRARDLPNHPQTNQRQIALDFMSSYDAMVAQEKLEGYQYEMQDGRQYPLRAKINKCEEYMQSMQIEWSEWPSMALIPHLDGEAYHRANARLHHGYSESEASSKRSRSRSRDHRSGSWHRRSRSRDRHGDRSSRYRSRSKERVLKYPQIEGHNHDVERSRSYGKRSRQPRELRDRSSSQESIHKAERSPARKRLRELRSMSKEHIVQSKKRSRSKDKRSRSKDRVSKEPSRNNHGNSRESIHRDRSISRERSTRHRSRERESSRERSKDKISRSKDRVSEELNRNDHGNSRESIHRDRSISRERRTRRSRERIIRSRKRSKRRSGSREDHSDDKMSKSVLYRRRSRSNERRVKPLAIMPKRINSPRESATLVATEAQRVDAAERRAPPGPWGRRRRRPRTRKRHRAESAPRLPIMPRSPRESTIISYEEDDTFTPQNIKQEADIQRKASTKKEKDDVNTNTNENKTNNITENKTINIVENKSKPKTKEEKKIAMLHARVKEFTKDVMVVIILLLEDIITKNNIVISTSNKELLVKDLDALVKERVEPLARKKKNTDIEVLLKYKELYPKEEDSALIKQMLAKIPEIKMVESETTTRVSSEQMTQDKMNHVILDAQKRESEQNHETNLTQPENIISLETNENLQQIPQETVIIDSVGKKSSPLTLKQEKTQDVEKEEKTKEKDVIIDLDSANKPVPRNPQFVVVIKTLCKQMNKSGGLSNLLGKERVGKKQFSYVLRHILRNLLKGQGHLPRAQITCKFREIYPICNDKEFIKNVIQDIKDGKYPGCLDHIDITSEDDQPDDVIVIENQYDTVTLSDSEVDDQPDDVIVIENQYDTVTLSDSEGKENEEESQLASGDINSSHPDNNDDTEKIQGNETNKFIDNPAQDNIDTKETRENDGNDLRVTAITIMTSLSELLTKTTNEPREEPVTDIKEELEYEEEKLDESSLQLVPDNVPKVTSITIMTSDAELFSICQDGGKKVSDIKSEDYDAEESLLNDIKRDIENDKFNLQMDDHLNHIEQNYSVIDSNTSNALNSSNVSQTNDDDETNESIRRYVASLF